LRIAEFGLRIWNKEMVPIGALSEIPRGKAPSVSGRFQSAIRNPNSAIKSGSCRRTSKIVAVLMKRVLGVLVVDLKLT
jgi:hypothetical protein